MERIIKLNEKIKVSEGGCAVNYVITVYYNNITMMTDESVTDGALYKILNGMENITTEGLANDGTWFRETRNENGLKIQIRRKAK